MVIHRLLTGLDPRTYCLLSRHDYRADTDAAYTSRLPARYYHLPPAPELRRGYRFGLSKVRESLNLVLEMLWRGREVAAVIRREQCQAVVACTGDLADLPAAYLASRLTRVRFLPYVFDDFAFQHLDPVKGAFARRLDPFLMRGAAEIIVVNEFLQAALHRRYGVPSAVIHNPCGVEEFTTPLAPGPERAGGGINLVYTGAIYEAHYDAVWNLLRALDLLERSDVTLHLYTADSQQRLTGKGIVGPVVYHSHQPLSAMPAIQRRADVLFLPLAFSSPYPEIVKTSAPTKLAEYLAARRPILVHAPADSFVAWYFREHVCGLVVDENDPAKLARGLERLLADTALQERLAANAWQRAQTDFSISGAQAAFARLVRLDPSAYAPPSGDSRPGTVTGG